MPQVQNLFTTPRVVLASKFLDNVDNIVRAVDDPPKLKELVEALAFNHMNFDVTPKSASAFRDSFVGLFADELQREFDSVAREGMTQLISYIGGAMIFVSNQYKNRIKLIQESWSAANSGRGKNSSDGRRCPSGHE